MKRNKYQELKDELKALAKEIRYWKSKRKLEARMKLDPLPALWLIEEKVSRRKREFRHKHIAYCQLRGRARHEIEQPAENNLPDEKIIQEIMDKYAEDVCACAEGSA